MSGGAYWIDEVFHCCSLADSLFWCFGKKREDLGDVFVICHISGALTTRGGRVVVVEMFRNMYGTVMLCNDLQCDMWPGNRIFPVFRVRQAANICVCVAQSE